LRWEAREQSMGLPGLVGGWGRHHGSPRLGGGMRIRPWVSQAWWEKWNGSWAIKLTILQYLCTRATRSNNCATLVQHHFILFMCNSSSLEILDMQFTPKINFLLPWYFNNVSCTIFSYFCRT